jgi:uncharacterized protein YjbJ (UPF0337 family)
MNWQQVEGKWKQYKGQAKQRWGRLTDDDLDVIDGKREELVGRLQSLYAKSREDTEREIDEWQNRL